jgi:transposase
MIAPPANTQIWIAAGVTDLRRGFTGLSALVQTKLEQTPFSGQVFVFRGRRGDLIKVLWFDGDGLCLFSKRLERGRFVWPQASSGTVALTRAQLSMLLEGRLAAAGAHVGSATVGVTCEVLLQLFLHAEDRCAKIHASLDPEAYLHEVLSRIADHPITCIEELLPWNIISDANEVST